VEDAVEATKAALEKGIVAGGGIVLFNESIDLREKMKVNLSNTDKLASEIFSEALSAPLRQIILNAGQSPEIVIMRILEFQQRFERVNMLKDKTTGKSGKELIETIHYNKLNPDALVNIGYDAGRDMPHYGDMIELGIIDPAKVVISALQNAVSAAVMLLTTEAVVTDIPEKKEKGGGMPDMSGMGGMGM